MRLLNIALVSLSLVATLPTLALAQQVPGAASPVISSLDVRPAFDIPNSWVGSSVHSRNSGLRLLCTLQSKNTPDQNVTMTLDAKTLSIAISVRIPPQDTQVSIISQGAAVATNQGAKTSSLRTVSSIILPAEALEGLKNASALEIQIKDDPTPMSVMLNNFSQAAQELQNCMK